MLRHIYSLLLLLAAPLILLRLLLKSTKSPGYRQGIAARFGFFNPPDSISAASQVVWIHAVSVGETVAAAPLVKSLLTRALMTDESIAIVLTTTTPTGAARAAALFGGDVHHLYAPYDLGFAVRNFLKCIKPQLLIIMETELWPNMLHYCKVQGIKSLLANARMSEKSAKGYQRFGRISKDMLQSIDLIAAQSEKDKQRLVALGAVEENTTVTGSLKFHIQTAEAGQADVPLFKSVAEAGRPVVIAASTRDGEEGKVLDSWRALSGDFTRPLLLLVPRHPERFDTVAAMCSKAGWSIQRRSEATELATPTDILLGDSMGELLAYYALADIAFVGGSLVDTGCQNVLEPAALGVPVLVGPSQYNFATICEQLERAGALQTVADSEALAQALSELLTDEARRHAMGEAGRALVAANQQALPQQLAMIDSLLN